MAGQPLAAVVTAALPKDFKPERIERVYTGINALAERSGWRLSAGKQPSNPERLLLSIALLGEVARDKCLLRGGAKEGDALFVSGDLGGARGGNIWNFSRGWRRRNGWRRIFPFTP